MNTKYNKLTIEIISKEENESNITKVGNLL